MRLRTLLFAAVVLMTSACSNEPAETSIDEQVAAFGEIDYNFHVKPILSQNCYLCHGPDPGTREAELRLDQAEDAYAERDSFPAIRPGNPEESMLFHRITSKDVEERMPPPEAHKELTPLQIGILTKWIEQGAPFKPHWAFIPPLRPQTPDIDSDWIRNDIDAFILASLNRQGLSPSPEASRRVLIRRLSFDLTGLPPTPAEITDFLNDDSETAYETLVDRLLTSPRFGERMALHWLDLARYADTNGYSIDGGRHMWLWRDWVIRAFNDNMPYDRFITEQLAGDLLPDPTESQLIATGFNRNNMNTHEGGTIPEENLTNYVADRVKTTSEAFLGLTMACAQCHDHKFDPLSQHDYYRFFAYFNTASDIGLDGNSGINSKPFIEARTPLVDESEIKHLKQEIEQLRERQKNDHPAMPAWEEEQRSRLLKRGRDLSFSSLNPLRISTPNRGNTGRALPDSSLLIDEGGWMAAYNVSAELPRQANKPITGLRIIFYPNEVTANRLGHGKRENFEGSFVMTSLTVSKGTIPSDQVDLYNIVPLSHVTGSTTHPNFPTLDALDERPTNGWAPQAGDHSPQHFTATFSEPIDAGETPYLTAMLNFGQGDNLIPGHFRLYAMYGIDDGTNVPAEIQDILSIPSEERTKDQADRLRVHFYKSARESEPLRHTLENLEERLAVLTEPHSTMIMDVAEEPRETFVLNRGQYDQPAEKVSPNTPKILPAVKADTPPNRLGLAQWLTDSDHPLTARVSVNRFWQILFGRGIVASAADFGAQGALPTHPELLDWLAVEFVDDDWDVKALLKQMVMSAAYRQQSEASEKTIGQDPENVWLARGPRFRLQAEFIRDAALYTSGLMVNRIGGPSVNPYQPAGLWKEISHYGSSPATAQVFVQDHGEKLYRRSMYTYWKRTGPPPAMLTFDAPNREVCTITRESTNTPLQALVMLNDPQFVEANRHLAERLLTMDKEDDERLATGFEIVLSRRPNRGELRILKDRLAEERAFYEENPDDAETYLAVGESPRNQSFDASEHAAWTAVASMIMNLSEAITRG